MRRASYTIISVSPTCVKLVDDNLPESVSVTNDAERVVEEVLAKHPGRLIFYRDTMGRWDQLCHDGSQFTGYAPGALDTPQW